MADEVNYIGVTFEKPLPNEKIPEYAKVAEWCNAYVYAHIEDKGDRYEVVEDERPPEPTPEELAEREKAEALAKAKAERAEAVANLKVTVAGKVFDADETSQNRMARVVAGAQALGVDLETTTQIWVLADNTVAQPTVAELAQALKLAGEAQTALWTKPYEETEETTGE